MGEIDVLQMDERLAAAQRGEPDPVQLDRQVARAHAAYQRWWKQLRSDPEVAQDDPLLVHRSVARRSTFRDLDRLGEQDPLRPYLRRWVFRLAERRINAQLVAALEVELRHQKKAVQIAKRSQLSLAEMLINGLRQASQARQYFEAYTEACGPWITLRSTLWERRSELVGRWGLSSLDQMTGCGTPAAALASAWLLRTEDAFFEYRRGSLDQLVELALARDGGTEAAKLDWPGQLSWRVLSQFFSDTELMSSLQLSSKRLPERIAPASFVRGLVHLGEQWSLALAPSDQFFVVAHDPYRLQAHTHGALFGMLCHSESFLRHRLGASLAVASAARRSLYVTLLIESRVRAFKVLAREAALQGRTRYEGMVVEQLNHHFGLRLPSQGAGGMFSPGQEDVQRFVGLLLASTLGDTLTEQHNEDWFRNPRGAEQLRSEACLPPRTEVEAGEIERGASSLYEKIATALG